jgi:hypothetical protein
MEAQIKRIESAIRSELFTLELLFEHFDNLRDEIDSPGQDGDFRDRLDALLNGRGLDKGLNQVIGDFMRALNQRNQLIRSLENSSTDIEIELFKRSQIDLQEEYNGLLPRIQEIREYIDGYVPPARDVIQGGQGSWGSLSSQNPALLTEVDVIPGFPETVSSENEMGRNRFGNLICMICLEDVLVDDELCRIDCQIGHVFHCGCIRDWVNVPNKFCPLCRPPAQGDTETYYAYMHRVDAAPGLTQIANVSLAPDFPLKVVEPGPSFGKSKIKSLEKIIKYLLKL